MPAHNKANEFTHPGYLTTQQAADALSVSRDTVCRYIRTGKMTALAKKWYYGWLLRTAYLVPIDEIKRFGMQRVVAKYAKPEGWRRASAPSDAILREGT